MDTATTSIASIAGDNAIKNVETFNHEHLIADELSEETPDPCATASEPKVVSKYAHLEPMGACWFCHKQVDSVRRFCSKTCSQDFDNEIDAY